MPEMPRIFDRAALRARRRRAAAVAGGDWLVSHLADEAAERLAGVLRDFPRVLDLATPGHALADRLRRYRRVGTVLRLESTPEALAGGALSVAGEPDALPFADASLDLVVSLVGLSAVDDLPGALLQVRRALRPDGLFLAAVFGEGTLVELRQAFAGAESEMEGGISPRVAPFADVRSLGALLQRAGFALPVVDGDRLVVRHGDPLGLLADLRAAGLANPLAERSRAPLRRTTLARALDIYRSRFADPDGRVRASFEIAWLSGWAPDESQPKPLRPGSARMRLAEALGTAETPLPRR